MTEDPLGYAVSLLMMLPVLALFPASLVIVALGVRYARTPRTIADRVGGAAMILVGVSLLAVLIVGYYMVTIQ